MRGFPFCGGKKGPRLPLDGEKGLRFPRSSCSDLGNEGVSDPFPHRKRESQTLFPPQKGKPRTSQNPLSENPAATGVGRGFRQSFSQPRDWRSSWRDFWKFGGVRAEVSGSLDFLEVALMWKFPCGILPKQTSKKFASEPPKLLRSDFKSLQKRFHTEACPSNVLG